LKWTLDPVLDVCAKGICQETAEFGSYGGDFLIIRQEKP